MDDELLALQNDLTNLRREVAALRASIKDIAREQAEEVLGTLIIKNGQNINFSGKGRNITANVTIPNGVFQGTVQCVDGVGVISGGITF